MLGHGELAFVSRHRLYLLRTSGLTGVPLSGRATRPAWSPDGRWLVVTTSPAPPKSDPYADEPTSVWLVSQAGKPLRKVTPGGAHDATATWSPRADRVAVTYRTDRRYHAVVVDASGRTTRLAEAVNISGLAWSPDGRRIALGLSRFVRPATRGSWRSEILVMSATARHAHSVARDRGGLYVIADWWPDGGGVMAWMDPMGSGSIRADGLPLYDFDVDGGRRRLTTSMLTYPAWLATSRPHDEVALIAGGDRELTGANKHVVVCAPRHCRSIPQPKNLVSFDPTWTTSGRLAVVRDRAIPATDNNGGFGPAFSDRVDGSGGIDIVRGAKADPIAGGDGATAPVWGRDGSILMVRNHAVWLRPTGEAAARRIAGPVDAAGPFNQADPYYGFVNWRDSFAWTAASR